MSMHGDHDHGAAWRRRQRRLRMHWRHEQLTLQMLLATYEHHSAPRRQTMARAWRWERAVLHGTFRSIRPPRRQALSTFLLTSKMCLPLGCGLGSRRPSNTSCSKPTGRPRSRIAPRRAKHGWRVADQSAPTDVGGVGCSEVPTLRGVGDTCSRFWARASMSILVITATVKKRDREEAV